MARLIKPAGKGLYLGIDPGRQGYMTLYNTVWIPGQYPIPYLGDEIDLAALFASMEHFKSMGVDHALVERQVVMGQESAKVGFMIGGGYMAIKAALLHAEIPMIVKDPSKWKREMDIPVPDVKKPPLPKKPKKPKRGASRIERADYDTAVAERKAVQKLREQANRKQKVKRKELAERMARELAPRWDFRGSERARKAHDGKVESFLMAVLCSRIVGGGR